MKIKNFASAFAILLGSFSFTHAIIVEDDDQLEKSTKWGKGVNPVCFVGTSFEDGAGRKMTGVLVAPDLVLTCAHGVRGGQGIKLNYVIFGNDIKDDPQLQVTKVKEVIPHPNINMDSEYYVHGVDLALLRLEKKVSGISPVKLYEADVKKNDQFYVCGFGPRGTYNKGYTHKMGVRALGTTRIEENVGDRLMYGYSSPQGFVEGGLPSTVTKTENMDKTQAMLGIGDSGAPLLKGKVTDLSLSGIYVQVTGASVGDVSYITQEWVPIQPHLEWLQGYISLSGK